MIKAIVAADLHLDSPFEALGDKASIARKEQRELLTKIADAAASKNADMILLAGDLLDSRRCFRETLDALRDTLGACPSQVFISPGNHDYLCPSSPYVAERFPENIHIFKTGYLSSFDFNDEVTVWGAGYSSISCPPLLREFLVSDNSKINICVLHGEVSDNSSYCPIAEKEIAVSGLDFLALGHIHIGSGLRKAGETYYLNPGCPQGRNFKETGDKGIYYAEIEKGSVTAEFIPTAKRKYEIYRMSPDNIVIPEGAENNNCRIILSGETDKTIDTDKLYRELAPKFFSLQIKDETILSRNLWDGKDSDSLRGIFLRKMRIQYNSAASDEERQKVAIAVKFGLAALDGTEVPEDL